MQDVSLALLLAAVIIVIGSLGSILFRKTQNRHTGHDFPSIAWAYVRVKIL